MSVVLAACVVASVLVVDLTSLSAEAPPVSALAHHLKRGFRNVEPTYSYTMSGRAARLQLGGINILTEPHWGDRASPVRFAGPRRLVAPGIRFEDLPPIHAVVISHDHYDHLDAATVTRLAREHAPTFFVPLGWGGGKEIGQRLGPFDVAAIPIGGYSSYEKRHPNHVNPEEAVQLFEDVKGRLMVPMHWGTFELNREPFREPPQRLQREALRRGLEEHVALLSPGQTIHW